MSTQGSLPDQIDWYWLDHVSLEVRYGMIDKAVGLFGFLGYSEDNRKSWTTDKGEGVAVFMAPIRGTDLQFQLSSQPDINTMRLTEYHPAYAVFHPQEAAEQVAKWARIHGLEAEIAPVDGGRYFVSIPEVLAFSIEFIPIE